MEAIECEKRCRALVNPQAVRLLRGGTIGSSPVRPSSKSVVARNPNSFSARETSRQRRGCPSGLVASQTMFPRKPFRFRDALDELADLSPRADVHGVPSVVALRGEHDRPSAIGDVEKFSRCHSRPPDFDLPRPLLDRVDTLLHERRYDVRFRRVERLARTVPLREGCRSLGRRPRAGCGVSRAKGFAKRLSLRGRSVPNSLLSRTFADSHSVSFPLHLTDEWWKGRRESIRWTSFDPSSRRSAATSSRFSKRHRLPFTIFFTRSWIATISSSMQSARWSCTGGGIERFPRHPSDRCRLTDGGFALE